MSIKTLKQQLLSDYSVYNYPTSSKKASEALIKAFRGRVKYITTVYLFLNTKLYFG